MTKQSDRLFKLIRGVLFWRDWDYRLVIDFLGAVCFDPAYDPLDEGSCLEYSFPVFENLACHRTQYAFRIDLAQVCAERRVKAPLQSHPRRRPAIEYATTMAYGR